MKVVTPNFLVELPDEDTEEYWKTAKHLIDAYFEFKKSIDTHAKRTEEKQ